MPFYDDPELFFDSEDAFFDDDGPGHAVDGPLLNQSLPALGSSSHMEFWEPSKERALSTLPIWQQHIPTVTVSGKTPDDLEDMIDDFEPKAQGRTAAQDVFDVAERAARTSLLKMKILGTKVAAIIEAQLSEVAAIMKDLQDVFRFAPRNESGILARLRALIPVWERANTALAAMTPAGGPITRPIQGVTHTVVMAKALLDGYTALLKAAKDKGELLDTARGALRLLDRQCLTLCQAWYATVKATYDPGSAVYDALAGIVLPGDTPLPDTIDIDTVVQGGDDGLHVLVTYEAGGGDHATTKQVEYKVEGIDADFGHAAALDASGNALGPFVVAQVVHVRTKVSNSTGTRTSSVRTITLEEPL
ncbi:MAG TPA: hypothetical protein VGO11_03725 [Chthoniobacteraceae bacterium]|jgi:hypothetical protein|nr:hypothetical protein [Chthoniobacteraceae bacterium]